MTMQAFLALHRGGVGSGKTTVHRVMLHYLLSRSGRYTLMEQMILEASIVVDVRLIAHTNRATARAAPSANKSLIPVPAVIQLRPRRPREGLVPHAEGNGALLRFAPRHHGGAHQMLYASLCCVSLPILLRTTKPITRSHLPAHLLHSLS